MQSAQSYGSRAKSKAYRDQGNVHSRKVKSIRNINTLNNYSDVKRNKHASNTSMFKLRFIQSKP